MVLAVSGNAGAAMDLPRTAESSADWAAQEFGAVELGDKRRTRRAVKVAAVMAAHPAASIPAQNQRWADTKATYRLFDQDDVTFQGVSEPHWRRTRQEASSRACVLLIQDGSQLDFTRHTSVEGLGFIGDGGGRGLMLHSVLAVDPAVGPKGEAAVLGLAHQQVWIRRQVPAGETRTQRKARQTQARVWTQAVEAVGCLGAARCIHVADREADNFDFFDACRRHGAGFLVRAYQDRRAALGHEAEESQGHLLSLVRQLPALGHKRLYVRRRPTCQPGWRTLQVAAAPVTLFAPWLNDGDAPPLRCWVVRVWEESTPGHEAIEWVLICSEPVASLSAALEAAQWYSLRWLIEEYHKCLKTGCRVEQRQLEDLRALQALIGMLAIVAVRLLQLKQQARLDPDRLAVESVSSEHVRMLSTYWGLPAETLTVYQFWRHVARLGGFLARTGDGEPGWQTLWQGWQKLDLMTLGATIERDNQKCG